MADDKKQLEELFEKLTHIDHIRVSDIPNIDLYMDQVTTFMDQHLKESKRFSDDKILTKTMINNYAKNDLLPPPIKKKYSKDHMLMLIFIYYFKNILSINDIKTLFEPLTSRFFTEHTEISLDTIYSELISMQSEQQNCLKEDIERKHHLSMEHFQDIEDESDKEYLQFFSFVCMLSFDVYSKKQLIESLIDEMNRKHPKNDKKKP